MRFCVVGAGAMGCLYGGGLAEAGYARLEAEAATKG